MHSEPAGAVPAPGTVIGAEKGDLFIVKRTRAHVRNH